MRRFLGFTGLAVTLALSVYVFEWQHVSNLNAGRIELLRLLFYGCVVAAVAGVFLGTLPWLPPAVMAFAFLVTAILSRAPIDGRAMAMAGALLSITFVCCVIVRRH